MQPPEGPPICTALKVLPSSTPPPISFTICRIVMPIGTSISPPCRTLPDKEKTFVPLLFSVPIAAKAAGPLRRIHGTQAKVSTLLMSVGMSQRPLTAGYGGAEGGMARSPRVSTPTPPSPPPHQPPPPPSPPPPRPTPPPTIVCP